MDFICSDCDYTTKNFHYLIKHYRHGHAGPDFYITCNIDGCHKIYRNVRAYKVHIKSKHEVFWGQYVGGHGQGQIQREEEIEAPEEDHDAGDEEPPEVDPNKEASSFLLHLRERFKVPGKTCEFVANELTEIIQLCRDEISNKVTDCLQRSGVDLDHLNEMGLCQAMSETMFEKAFAHLQNQKKLNKYVEEQYSHVKPVEYVLGHCDDGTTDTMQYVPIIQTIKALLQHDDVFSEVYEGHQTRSEILEDFCDGSYFKENALFTRNRMNLQLMLYYDDFTAGNPLGNKTKQTKIGGFYFLLGNLHPKFRSKLYVIQLAILAKSDLIKKYGIDKVIDPLVQDITKLEQEGICVSKDGVEHQMYGTVCYVSADNLGAHSIGGFMENFSTVRRVCRYCNVSKDDMQNHFRFSGLLTCRSKAAHTQQVKIVEENEGLSSFYGVKRNSLLNELNFYHVTTGLPGDIAHDLFEGVVPDVLKHVIEHCVRSEYFDLPYLNKQIKEFPYDIPDKTNKPSKVPETLGTFRVKQTAAQAWCMLRLLPLMVGSKVPRGDPVWEILLVLSDVVEYSTSTKCSPEQADMLADLIEEFLTRYFTEFPTLPMKPKFHFLIHYPQMMLKFGPLVHCWTLRFEGKHNYFKEIYHSTKNTKNICKTMAQRHEYLQASHRTKKNFLDQECTEHTFGVMYPLVLLSRDERELLCNVCQMETFTMVYKVQSVKYGGITYPCGSAVVAKNSLDSEEFSMIEACYIVNGAPFLFCRFMKASYLRHYHAFGVERYENCRPVLLQPSELIDYHPLGVYHSDLDKMIIPLKNHIQIIAPS